MGLVQQCSDQCLAEGGSDEKAAKVGNHEDGLKSTENDKKGERPKPDETDGPTGLIVIVGKASNGGLTTKVHHTVLVKSLFWTLSIIFEGNRGKKVG